ncbi:MAG: apolipoprotein N-acyltransferase [Verrucomicrobiota bacterium]
MNFSSARKFLQSRFALAIFAGLMLAFAFPKWNIAGFAWIAPGLILLCGAGQTPRQQFWIGYAAGVSHYLASLSWLLNIPFPGGAIAGWMALSAYCALYPATWVWLSWKVFHRLICAGKNFSRDEATFFSFQENFLQTTWKQRAIWSVICAAIWVALEMILARLFSGFPWNFLGTTQYRMTPLLQIASFTGVYGVSFLLVWFAVSLACAGVLLALKPQPSRAWSGEIILPALAAAGLFAAGVKHISPDDPALPKLKLALIQPSIPQTLIFDPSQNEKRFAAVMELSERALAEKPDVLVWPEAATPPVDEEKYAAITNLISRHHVWMIFCADDSTNSFTANGKPETNYFNSSFFFSPNGNYLATYRKQQLVIFGEYVPLSHWLPFMKWLTPIDGGFTPGTGSVPFQIESPRAKLSALICFEDAFPHYVREHVAGDTDFLLNLTNDGWFGQGAAHWQQAANALFRAIELAERGL